MPPFRNGKNGNGHHTLKATRKPPDDAEQLNPDGVQMRRFEREGTEQIAAALAQWQRDLFRGVTTTNAQQRLIERLNDQSVIQPLQDTITALVQKWALAGADFGQEQVERNVFGTIKAASIKQTDPLGINWELANNAAAEWALNHSAELVRSISDTTRARIQAEVANFVRNDETINQLSQRLEPMFSPVRAEMISVTEVTRSFSEANQIAWQESGVIDGKEWRTNNDELVCPICGPLDSNVVPTGQQFDGGFDGPPAHPRCRCWVVPVPITEENRIAAERAEEIAFLEGIAPDRFAAIRPPAGRAPRGQGQEFKLRRRIISRIESQIRFRGQAQRHLDQFRGQTGSRIRFKIDVAKERVRELNKGISAMMDIANDPITDDWVFKNELIDGIIEHVSAARAF
jgi:SPP1 gp7 family putative phage head morphogenesis protein